MRILLAEQEPSTGLAALECLGQAGFAVVGPASTVVEACEMAGSGPLAGALCPLNLADGRTDDLIALLAARRVPTIITTASLRAALPSEVAHLPVLVKPYGVEELRELACRCFTPPTQ